MRCGLSTRRRIVGQFPGSVPRAGEIAFLPPPSQLLEIKAAAPTAGLTSSQNPRRSLMFSRRNSGVEPPTANGLRRQSSLAVAYSPISTRPPDRKSYFSGHGNTDFLGITAQYISVLRGAIHYLLATKPT